MGVPRQESIQSLPTTAKQKHLDEADKYRETQIDGHGVWIFSPEGVENRKLQPRLLAD